jgi:transposase
MRDTQLYARILGIGRPWQVTDVELDRASNEVRVRVEHADRRRCPTCGEPAPGYDRRSRRWRHLDTCQYRTILIADVPRVNCPQHGVQQIEVPWSEPGSRFTALFEALVIDWLGEASISAVAQLLNLSWDEADGIMQRAVDRGLARRDLEPPRHVSVDEVSSRRGHRYLTVVSDREEDRVVHVAPERKQSSLESFYEQLGPAGCETIDSVTMDMWPAYIQATEAHLPEAESKIAFDKFHVAQHLGDAVDGVRRVEQKELKAAGNDLLSGTRFLWLRHPKTVRDVDWRGQFAQLRNSTLRTARAWAIKESAMMLWDYRVRGWARRGWQRWYDWAIRSRLEPVKKVARMVKKHLWGIINAVVLRATNAGAESINARIQRIKRMACGFRNQQRFQRAIYFHLGRLDLKSELSITHTNV